jgi:hypothetical protein
MPPFVPATCPFCKKANTYDWLDLKATEPGAKLFRALTIAPVENEHIFVVACQHCHERFKISVPEPGGEDE